MVKTWRERCEEHPDHQSGMVTTSMIQQRMQEEIDELRTAIELVRAQALEDAALLLDELHSKDTMSNYYKVAANKVRALKEVKHG